MAEENLNEEQQTFKIADRRKFNVDGSLREGVVIEETPTKHEPTITAASPTSSEVTSDAAPNVLPNVSGADESDIFESSEDETFATNSQSDFSGDLTNSETAADDEPLDELNIPGAENPASFANFLLSLASQAAAAMGMTENPMAGGGRRVDLETSRYWLEVLGMLHQKTKGNLQSQEQKLFDGLLSDLRMQYVQIARAAEAQMRKQEEQLLKQAGTKFTGKDILGR
jgi:hypothetical protein